MFQSIWKYRYFIASTVRGDLQARFSRSYLGALWFILHPLAQTLIFAVVLSEVLAARLPANDNKSAYAIYLLAGMSAWGLFAEIVNRSMTIFLEQAAVMKKIAFPRLCLPVIVLGGALINHGLLLAAIVVVFAALGHFAGWAWLALPIGIVLISILGFGIGLACGVINIFSRDVAQVMAVVMQLWFWVTPIVYPANVIPQNFAWLVELNPMTPLVQLYQNALLLDQWPSAASLAYPAVVGITAFAIAYVLFRRASPEIVDVL